MPRQKVKKREERSLVDPDRKPSYHEGGRAPMTSLKLVPLTVALDSDLYDDIRELSERFISPKSGKPYGVSSVVRIIVELALDGLAAVTDADLLYYVSSGSKGAVGRWPLADEVVKMSVLLPRDHVLLINSRITPKLSKIVGTTTLVRYLLRSTVGEVGETDLYSRIPESHKEIMRKENLTPRKLRSAYRATKA